MSTLATKSTTNDRGHERTEAVVMEPHAGDRGGGDYLFVFDSADGLECVIRFDTVTFDHHSGHHGTDPEAIRTIRFYRTDPRRPKLQTGQVEGGRSSWGDEIVDTLAAIRDSELDD
jgi:hypothetical protein